MGNFSEGESITLSEAPQAPPISETLEEPPEATEQPPNEAIVTEAIQTALAADDEKIPNAKTPEVDHLEKNLDILEAYYGDQQFQYKSYTGTIFQIVAICPPIMALLDMPTGADDIIAMVDQYKMDPDKQPEGATEDDEVPNPDDATANTLLNTPEKTVEADEPPQEKSRQKTENVTPVPKHAIEHQPVTVTDPDTSLSPNKEAPVKPEGVTRTQKSQPAIVTVPRAATPLVSPQMTVQPPSTLETTERQPELIPEPELTYHIEQPLENNMPTETVQDLPEAEIADLPNTPGGSLLESNVFIAKDVEDVRDETEQDDGEVEEEVENKEVVTLAHETVALDDPTVHIVEAHTVDEETHDTKTPIIIPHAEIAAPWQELAQEDAPLEETLITAIQRLHELPPQAPELAVPTEELETLPTSQLTKADHTELSTIILYSQEARTALERLYASTTKEECQEYGEAFTLQALQLLRALGYTNPEGIVRDFLHKHSPSQLLELLTYLETYAKRTVETSLVQQTKTHQVNLHQRHHSYLGKLAMLLFREIVPKKVRLQS